MKTNRALLIASATLGVACMGILIYFFEIQKVDTYSYYIFYSLIITALVMVVYILSKLREKKVN